jgi:small subunit ribosomal protein S20
MAHHKSAKKRIRRNERRRVINRDRVGELRTSVKKTELAIESGDKAAAEAAFRAMQPVLHRGVTKNSIHRNTVARKLSRLSARIKTLQPSS